MQKTLKQSARVAVPRISDRDDDLLADAVKGVWDDAQAQPFESCSRSSPPFLPRNPAKVDQRYPSLAIPEVDSAAQLAIMVGW